jgi:hypothetical protein
MRTSLRRYAAMLPAAAILVGAPILADAAGDDSFSPGPGVGERIPAFRLPDQHGKNHTFKDLTGPDGLLLLFYRTADW